MQKNLLQKVTMMAFSQVKNSGRRLLHRSDVRVWSICEDSVKVHNKNFLRVGAWNVRSLKKCGRLENLKQEMKRMELDVVGISEMRWDEEGDFWSEDFRIIHSGSVKGQAGVGFMMNKQIGLRVKSYYQYSERIIMMKVSSKPKDSIFIQVYMPTTGHDDEEVERVYEDLESLLKYVKGDENLIILGDWNAVVGEGKDGKEVGNYGLGQQNDRGKRLVEFCVKHKMVVTNTLFKNPKRRRYTWTMPGDRGRYQIDYILVKQRFRNQVKDCKSYPGADIDSDHNLVMMKCDLKFKKLKCKKHAPNNWDLQNLNEETIAQKYKNKSNEIITKMKDSKDIETNWKAIKQCLKTTAANVLIRRKPVGRKPWITEEIMDLIEQRRTFKNSNNNENKAKYRRIKNQIDRECKKAKEKWLEQQCDEIDDELKKGKTDAAYRKVKQHFGNSKTKGNVIRNKNGKALIESIDKAERWKEYLEELYNGRNGTDVQMEKENQVEEEDLGDEILRSEFDRAIKDLKKGKAPGVDGIPAELIVHSGREVKDRLFKLISNVYNTGEAPQDFEKNVIVTIPKKIGAEKCEDYRTISLTSHASKIITRILYRRLEKNIEENLAQDQFGFRKNSGTREAILALRQTIDKRIHKNLPTYIGFVDLEKAFDNVNWPKMFEILKNIGIKYRDRRLIYSLYRNQKAVIRCEEEEREASIQKGVRQGCSLSPLLFNIYIEEAINKTKANGGGGVIVQGEKLQMLRFADDIALLAKSEKELEKMLNEMESIISEEYNMKINKKKTKVMVCRKKDQKKKLNVKIGNDKLEEVNEFCYLGSVITRNGKSKEDIKRRIGQAKRAFLQKERLLTSNIDLNTRKKLLKSYVWSIALYGCETWTVGKEEKRRIDAFEMWCYRKMMKIRWDDFVRNEEILEVIEEPMSIWKVVKSRRDRMIGHILRHEGLVKTVLEGKVEGKNARGRPRLDYIKQIVDDVGCRNYYEMKMLAQQRKEWKNAINN